MDTLLGVLAHSSLAFGLVFVSFLSGIRIDLMAYLFGDISSSITIRSCYNLAWCNPMVILLMYWRWSALLLSTLNEEMAYASGLNPKRDKIISNTFISHNSCCCN